MDTIEKLVTDNDWKGSSVIVGGCTGSGREVMLKDLVERTNRSEIVVIQGIENLTERITEIPPDFDCVMCIDDLQLKDESKVSTETDDQEYKPKEIETLGETARLLATALINEAGNHWFETKDTTSLTEKELKRLDDSIEECYKN